MYKNLLKRLTDVLVSFTGLIILSPVFLVTTIVLFFANQGRPFFFQNRPGKGERNFKVIKFKTMDDKRGPDGNLASDSERLTRIGSLVRKLSLDEIPQLINVLKGDMSLIGPRPLLERYLPFYTEREHIRHSIRPGITGLAQVNGRNNLTWSKRLLADIYYVENISFMLDLKIFFKTVKNIISSKDIVTLPSDTMLDLDVERKREGAPYVEQLQVIDLKEAESIRVLLVESYPIEIRPYVIYSDENYARYLTQVVSDSSLDKFFVLRMGAKIAGLIHFKINEDILFLNNIVVDRENHGAGFGKMLYNYATEKLLSLTGIRKISLDVFSNNQLARGWYRKMGFVDNSTRYWYNLGAYLEETNDTKLEVAKDSNGFSGLYYNSEKIASIINGEALVFRDKAATAFLRYVNRGLYNKAVLIAPDELEYSRLAISNRMTLNLN